MFHLNTLAISLYSNFGAKDILFFIHNIGFHAHSDAFSNDLWTADPNLIGEGRVVELPLFNIYNSKKHIIGNGRIPIILQKSSISLTHFEKCELTRKDNISRDVSDVDIYSGDNKYSIHPEKSYFSFLLILN